MHNLTILDTSEMVTAFDQALSCEIDAIDHLEIFQQLFQILDKHSPLDLTNRNVLHYDRLLFANHLKVDHVAADQAAYQLMVRTWQLLQQHNFYVNGELMYFPFSMNGWDLCVRRYNS